jgi:multiple sugar transport system ATP-binding protein
MAHLHLRNLDISLGGTPVIKGLDLAVEEGEFLVMLGPSGCGKSTLLHAIAGLVAVDGGSVEIGGADLTDAEPSERGIGMVFQSYALYPTMTVEGNMSFGLRMNGTPKAEIARRVAHAAQMLQLGPLLKRKPAQLSGGQRQRVAIGRALVREAGVFLFDEPLSNLDAKLRTELRRELKLLHRTLGSTMVYVTHDQVEAMTLASRIAVMRGGQLQQVGTPAEVYERPANLFVAGFLGAPAMNFIRGRIDADRRLAAGALAIDLRACFGAAGPGSEVVLGVRPEHIAIGEGAAHEGRVTLVEPMGHHQVVWIDAGGHTLSALVHDGPVLASGDAIRFDIDAARAGLFDPESGQRL